MIIPSGITPCGVLSNEIPADILEPVRLPKRMTECLLALSLPVIVTGGRQLAWDCSWLQELHCEGLMTIRASGVPKLFPPCQPPGDGCVIGIDYYVQTCCWTGGYLCGGMKCNSHRANSEWFCVDDTPRNDSSWHWLTRTLLVTDLGQFGDGDKKNHWKCVFSWGNLQGRPKLGLLSHSKIKMLFEEISQLFSSVLPKRSTPY